MLVVLDFGNARIKWFNPKENRYGDTLHAIARLTEQEWRSVVGRGAPPQGVIKVNGVPYAVGDAARRHVLSEKPKGASRYREDYYGIGLCFALTECVGRSCKVQLYASHAPQDQRYTQNIAEAACRQWTIEYSDGTIEINVTQVVPFDEPIGGLANYMFTEKGELRRKNMATDKTSLVIDVGGYTADRAAIDPGGKIDVLSLASVRAGTIEALASFENDLRDRYRSEFQDTGAIDIRRIEQAIVSGEFAFGKTMLQCKDLAQNSINRLVNDVKEVINAAGGAANYDMIILTGGGSALIYDALVAAYPNVEFVLSEPTRALMKFSNVFGGAKIAALMQRARS